MTGPVGARTNLPVALVTDDFRLYHELVPLFERHGVNLLGLKPGEEVPEAVEVLIGGPPDDPRSVPIHPDPEATLLEALAGMDPRPTAQAGYHEVVFGLDPGKTIGLAVVADGEPLMVAEARDATEAADQVLSWKAGLTASVWRVHIGDGAPDVGIRLEGEFHARVGDAQVRFVPEEATSPGSPQTKSRHTDAAIHIALRRPQR